MRSLVGSLLNKGLPQTTRTQRSGLFGLGKGAANDTRYLGAMGSVGTVFGIVSRIAQSTAQVDWCLYRASTDRRRSYATTPPPRVEITKHPALAVWNKPNPFMTQQAFIETFSQHVELVGESEWYVAEHPDIAMPYELWPIRPDKIQPVPDPEEFLKGWIYTGPDGQRVPLLPTEVIQIKMPNPTDVYRGMGPVQTILYDLDSVRYSAEWNANFFINGAQPGGVIEVQNNLSDPEFEQFNQRWRESHRGVANAHKVAMLENGQKWVDVNFSQKDMQFAELRSVSQAVIREAWGISKTMLGQTEDVNRATAEAAEYVFARWLLTSRLDRIRDALNTSFLPLFGTFGEGVEFDYHSPVPEDLDREAAERTSKTDAAVALVGAGWEPNEVLEAMGLPAITFKGRPDGPAPASGGDPVPANARR